MRYELVVHSLNEYGKREDEDACIELTSSELWAVINNLTVGYSATGNHATRRVWEELESMLKKSTEEQG